MTDPISILADRGKLTRQTQNGNNSIVFKCLGDFFGLWGLDTRFWLEIVQIKS